MADPRRPLAVLVNPAAAGGRALKVLPEVRAELDRLGATYRVVETSSADHARSEAAAAVQRGEKVAGLGGDGLIGTVAAAMCRSEVPLAVLPGGRGNDLARVLGIPTEPAEAARVAVEGVEHPIDVAEANGKTFVGIASFGIDSDANRIANEAKLVKGNLVYLYAAVRALIQWRDANFEVVVDGERHSFRGCDVLVGNSKAYGGGMYALPHAVLDDGLLEVMVTTQRPKLALLRLTVKAFTGSHITDPALRFLRGREVEVSADRPFEVYADGDPVAELPARITVAERALRVMVPAS
ncbi:MAG: diacylglycerol kinase family lipid kinase [Actinomycetota bacterium]|nr:diacylglycerol kinase family lipid kinase [Actinomycetota bacterium]